MAVLGKTAASIENELYFILPQSSTRCYAVGDFARRRGECQKKGF
jgi:hypothetical protein